MLEEASYANHKADYFWLLVQSAGMLLVRLQPLHETPTELTAVLNIGIVTNCEPSLSLLSTGLRPYLHVVPTAPVYPNITLRHRKHHSTVPPIGTRSVVMDS